MITVYHRRTCYSLSFIYKNDRKEKTTCGANCKLIIPVATKRKVALCKGIVS